MMPNMIADEPRKLDDTIQLVALPSSYPKNLYCAERSIVLSITQVTFHKWQEMLYTQIPRDIDVILINHILFHH
jgi:hypothetical protein